MATRAQLQALADAEATRAGIPAELLRAIVKVESSWNPGAVRFEPDYWRREEERGTWRRLGLPWAGNPRRVASSYGLGQLMYLTALEAGFPRTLPPEKLLSPDINLRLTARHLARLWRRHGGRLEDVAAAYNSGRPMATAPAVTRNRYVPRILRAMGRGGSLGLPDWWPWAAAAVGAAALVALATRR